MEAHLYNLTCANYAVACLSASILTNSSASNHLFASILAASTPSNRSVLALVLSISLLLTSS